MSLSMWNEETTSVSSVHEQQRHAKDKRMKKMPKTTDSEMSAEYDFSQGVRGKYSERFAAGTNIVALSPDVAEAFPDSASVNKALRTLMKTPARKKASA